MSSNQHLGLRVPSRPKTTWPVLILLAVWAIGYVTIGTMTASLDGWVANRSRMVVQTLLFLIPLVRILIASMRAERSRTWIGYVIGMALSTPIWIFVVESLWDWLAP